MPAIKAQFRAEPISDLVGIGSREPVAAQIIHVPMTEPKPARAKGNPIRMKANICNLIPFLRYFQCWLWVSEMGRSSPNSLLGSLLTES